MVPCYRKNDNIVGMYDLVNDVFYENQGSRSFTKGNDVDNYDSNTDIFNFVTSNDVITTEEDHILYAIWEEE